jgi:hypothetical protein
MTDICYRNVGCLQCWQHIGFLLFKILLIEQMAEQNKHTTIKNGNAAVLLGEIDGCGVAAFWEARCAPVKRCSCSVGRRRHGQWHGQRHGQWHGQQENSDKSIDVDVVSREVEGRKHANQLKT